VQPIAHTRCPSGPTRDDHDRAREIRTIDASSSFIVDIVTGNDHDHAFAARERRRHCMIDDSPTTEILELLHRSESATGATGDDDRPDHASPIVRRTIALDIGHEHRG
jgi:hypothetical protein